jgi:hypothetical protein
VIGVIVPVKLPAPWNVSAVIKALVLSAVREDLGVSALTLLERLPTGGCMVRLQMCEAVGVRPPAVTIVGG